MQQEYQKSPQALYEGKASRLFEVEGHPELLIIERKDDITKQDGEVRDQIEGKGSYTNRISNVLFRLLQTKDIPTHYVQELSANETLIARTEPLMAEVIVRNIATGSLCKRLPFEDGTALDHPLVEFDYKSDEYHDPLINEDHAILLGVVKDYHEYDQVSKMALGVNAALRSFFQDIGIILVDFKLEFGRLPDGQIVVIDEISPDTCRLWDAKTRQSLDKDIFRKGGGNEATADAYREIFDRLADGPDPADEAGDASTSDGE